MIKQFLAGIVLLISIQVAIGQGVGANQDPFQRGIGKMPYEMEGRVEERKPLISFDDCTQWEVSSQNCDVQLYRTQEQRVFRKFSGKIIYKTKAKKAEFSVKLKSPIVLKEP